MPARIAVRYAWTSQPSTTACAILARSFSTTPKSQALGPESPNYIEVPKAVQPTLKRKPIVKGVLPVPRNIFKTRSTLPKDSDGFLSLSTPEPKAQRTLNRYSKEADYVLYKRRLAETRRQALKESVKQLHVRKTETERDVTAQSARVREHNKALAMAPPRQADVLTSTTVSKTIRDFLEDKLPSTSRQATQGQVQHFQRVQSRNTAIRQAHLHDLYTHARDFIVDEGGLDAVIEKEFGTDEKPVRWSRETGEAGRHGGESVWTGGAQDGVGEMLQKLRAGEAVDVAQERIRRVAEELTGGKM
jgi:hypothetical protein